MSSTATLPQDREKLFAYFEQQEQAKAAEAKPEAKPNGRQTNGRFAPGNSGGPGNPFGRRVGELRKAMLMAVNDDDLQEIMRALIDKAKEGHVPAAKLVLSYTVGKPTDAVDPDRKDIDEYQLEADKSVAARDLNAVLHSFPVDIAKAMLDIVWPCMLAKHGQTLNEMQAESERTKREIEELDQALKAEAARNANAPSTPPADPATTTTAAVPSTNGDSRCAGDSPAQPDDLATTNVTTPVPATIPTTPLPNGDFRPATANGEQPATKDREPGRAGETPAPREEQPPAKESRPSTNSAMGFTASGVKCARRTRSPVGD